MLGGHARGILAGKVIGMVEDVKDIDIFIARSSVEIRQLYVPN